MYILPAREFLTRFTNAYGETWEELFFDLTADAPCAKHFAELINDLEEYGQQTPVYVDKHGMVIDGNRVAMCLGILEMDVEYTIGDPAPLSEDQVFALEFDIDDCDEDFLNHLDSYLSFRFEEDWIMPIDMSVEDEDVTVVIFCPSGQYTADRITPVISERLERIAGASIGALRVSAYEALDEDASEW